MPSESAAPGWDGLTTMQVPPAHHLAIMCLVCKDGYGGTDLRGAQRWITEHIHPDPEDDE